MGTPGTGAAWARAGGAATLRQQGGVESGQVGTDKEATRQGLEGRAEQGGGTGEQ